MRKTAIVLATAALTALATAAQAQPPTAWQRHHPWRAHDNARLLRQNERIDAGVRDGQLTRGQARALRSDDRAIRAEERSDAAVNGSHLTPAEQRTITRQENANSATIYGARHP